MAQEYLPAPSNVRLADLMKEHNISQPELAKKLGCSKSTISCFISGAKGTLTHEQVLKIARLFNVSTDFLLGETNIPDRKNYDIAELGLSVEAAKNLYTGRVNTEVVNLLLENARFAELTYRISQYTYVDVNDKNIFYYVDCSVIQDYGQVETFDNEHLEVSLPVCHVHIRGRGSALSFLPERSVRIREIKGSNPSRSTFSNSVILTLLLFFCMCIGHTLALGPRGIRTARPCRRQVKQPAQCNGDDRSQWLKQGGAVGAAF